MICYEVVVLGFYVWPVTVLRWITKLSIAVALIKEAVEEQALGEIRGLQKALRFLIGHKFWGMSITF